MEHYTVHSVDRTFRLLELLSLYPQGVSLTELSRQTGLSKSTAYRLIASLVSHGYAVKDPQSNLYHVSLKLYELGCRAIDSMGFLTVLQPALRELAARTNEAVHFVVREGSSVVYLHKEESIQGMIRMASRVGLRNPMYCTGVGKAILAYLPESEQEEILETTAYQRFTEHTLCDRQSLAEDLQRTRQRGYAIDAEEHEIGVSCIAAPLLNSFGIAYAAISISAPTFRLTDARIEEYARMLLQAAENAAELLNM